MGIGRKAASVLIEASTRGLDIGLREATRKLKAFQSKAEKSTGRQRDAATGRFMKGGGGALGGAKSIMGGILGSQAIQAVGGFVADMAGEVFNVEKALTRFQIATDKTPSQLGAFREELNRVSRDSGLARDQILAGAASYVALTGDARGATRGMELFAKVANATGASMDDIAATAASMKDNLGIDPKDFEAGFSALTVQGKAGAIELRDLAAELSGIAPSFAKFKSGMGVTGLIRMGAALQVVRKGFGSASEASTGLRDFIVAIQRNAKKFEKAGIKIYERDPKTKKQVMRDVTDIVAEVKKSKAGMDQTKLIELFGREGGKRAFDQLAEGSALYDELIAKASDVNAISRDAATYQESSAGKIEAAWNNIKLAIAEAFTPDRIEKFADVMGKVAGWAEDIVGYIEYLLGEQETWEQKDKKEGQRDLEHNVARARAANPGMTKQQAKAAVQFEALTSSAYAGGKFDARGVAQLAAEKEQVKSNPGSYVNPQQRINAIDSAIARVEEAQRPHSIIDAITKGFEKARAETVVKVGAEPVAHAAANSPSHRNRTGGR